MAMDQKSVIQSRAVQYEQEQDEPNRITLSTSEDHMEEAHEQGLGHSVSIKLKEEYLVVKRTGKTPWYKRLITHKKHKIPLDDIFAVGTMGNNSNEQNYCALHICWIRKTSGQDESDVASASIRSANRRDHKQQRKDKESDLEASSFTSTVSWQSNGHIGRMVLYCQGHEERDQWMYQLRRRTIQWTQEHPANILIIVNPYSGKKKAKFVWREKTAPILEMAKEVMPDLISEWQMKVTKYKGHAIDIVKDMNLCHVNCIAACGGDGILHEGMLGLVQRKDYKELCQAIRWALIPAGTSNALCKTILNNCNTMHASALMVKGYQQPFDVISTFVAGKRNVIAISSHYGLFANISHLSENYRSLSKVGIGYARYLLAAIRAIQRKQYFSSILQYIPECNGIDSTNNSGGSGRKDEMRNSAIGLSSMNVTTTRQYLPVNHSKKRQRRNGRNSIPRTEISGPPCPLLDQYFPGYLHGSAVDDDIAMNLDKSAWNTAVHTVSGDFLLIMASNTAHFDSAITVDNDSVETLPSCGAARLSYIQDDLSRNQIYYGLYQSTRRNELSLDDLSVQHRMVRAFKITPILALSRKQRRHHRRHKPKLQANVDGEKIDTERPLYGEVHPALCRVITAPRKAKMLGAVNHHAHVRQLEESQQLRVISSASQATKMELEQKPSSSGSMA